MLDGYRIASFLLRDGQCHAYGVDSAVVDYSYFHQTLLDWIIEKMNEQADEGPAEDIAALLKASGYPAQALISVVRPAIPRLARAILYAFGDHSDGGALSGSRDRYDAATIASVW